jgi:NAD(P)-dependent dehydrogenase (short-subunit alcohol dehydrogenase family)
MTASLNGRVVAITGGARGIGLATARALRAAGAKVAIGDLDLDATTAAAESVGTDVLGAQLDVTDADSFRAFLDLAERELGPLDVLVNNAGIMPIGPFLEEKHTTAGKVLDVNVGGCMIGMKLALERMSARRSGHVVNVASVAGRSPVPGGASYAASKAAVVSLTETARVEFRGQGVNFTCVMPSFTATDLIAGTKGVKFIGNITPEQVATAIAAVIAKPRNDVFVPKSVAVPVLSAPLIGRRVRDAMNRMLGADKTFLDVDRNARAYYEDRIAAEKARESETV